MTTATLTDEIELEIEGADDDETAEEHVLSGERVVHTQPSDPPVETLTTSGSAASSCFSPSFNVTMCGIARKQAA